MITQYPPTFGLTRGEAVFTARSAEAENQKRVVSIGDKRGDLQGGKYKVSSGPQDVQKLRAVEATMISL